MTPIGHASISIILWKFLNKLPLIPFIVGGILPDIDFIFVFFTWFNSIHRVYTHNILFVLITGLLCFLWKNDNFKNIFIAIIIGGFAHLFIDSILDSNPSNGIGIALLFPLSSEVYSPFNLIPQSNFTNAWDINNGKFANSLFSIIIEIPFWVVATYIYLKNKVNNSK